MHLSIFLAVLLAAACLFLFFKIKANRRNVQEAFFRGKQAGYESARKEREEANKISEQIRRDAFLHVGAKVIAISNEWQDFNVGEIIEMSQVGKSDSYIPTIKDILSGEKMCCFGIVIPYTPEILHALNKLNPFERYSLAISSRMYDVNQYIFHKNKKYTDEEVVLTSASVVEEKLKAVGWL